MAAMVIPPFFVAGEIEFDKLDPARGEATEMGGIWRKMYASGSLNSYYSHDGATRAEVRVLANNWGLAAMRRLGFYRDDKLIANQLGALQEIKPEWSRNLKASRVGLYRAECAGFECGSLVSYLWYGGSVVRVRVDLQGRVLANAEFDRRFREFVLKVDARLTST